MTESRLETALRAAGIESSVVSVSPLSGGCIHTVRRVTLADGRSVVAKIVPPGQAPLLECEARGLSALEGTGTVQVPAVLGVTSTTTGAILLLEYLPPAPADDRAWARFGRELAALHLHPCGDRYGFDHDNFIGPTPQSNAWHEHWPRFNQACRIDPLVKRLDEAGVLDEPSEATLIALRDALPSLLPERPRPSLLHGDLWSGNALPTTDGRIALIDPAPSIGDGLADIAMLKLFGGFPPSCHRTYFERLAEAGEPAIPPRALEARIGVYQLYHLLNHALLFGGHYLGQATALARDLVSMTR